ncbi:RNA polymerase sigma factor [Cyclobacterium plantarum]|uniref:RNA polymerase sigma factor n=1 Tax=Cyclobacterium plantarum TaxID=2716263 RepID=UPI003F6FA3C4
MEASLSKRSMTGEFNHEKIKTIQMAIHNGDARALSPLILHYQNYVFQIAFRILKNREEAEEITQDVFVKVHKVLDTFKGESKFSTWLYRISHNLALNRLAKMARDPVRIQSWSEKQLQMPGSENDSWEIMEWKDRKKFIGFALEKLNTEDQLILTLFYLHEQQLGEIAVIMGIPPNNVKVKLHRARKKIETVLNQILNEEVNNL